MACWRIIAQSRNSANLNPFAMYNLLLFYSNLHHITNQILTSFCESHIW